MKFLLGGLVLIVATSTWACSPAPGDVYGCAGENDSHFTRNAPTQYGTSTRVITGHDGAQYIEVAPSYTPHDEVRVIDYSTPYISDRTVELEGQFQRFDLE